MFYPFFVIFAYNKIHMKGYIFDLDGVIVDTAKFHFLAWHKIAQELGFELTYELNEQLKGVSRTDSLMKILTWSNVSVSESKFEELAYTKNQHYLKFVEQMTQDDILVGVKPFLEQTQSKNIKIALGSASKNARLILTKLGIISFFDVIIDGNNVSKAKPDPEVFVLAAQKMGLCNTECIVFEDAAAGIEAAQKAQMLAVGIGDSQFLKKADKVFKNFEELINSQLF